MLRYWNLLFFFCFQSSFWSKFQSRTGSLNITKTNSKLFSRNSNNKKKTFKKRSFISFFTWKLMEKRTCSHCDRVASSALESLIYGSHRQRWQGTQSRWSSCMSLCVYYLKNECHIKMSVTFKCQIGAVICNWTFQQGRRILTEGFGKLKIHD